MLNIFRATRFLAESHVIVRHEPASPVFFGVFAFAILAVLLYLVLRLDRD
jgi:hypothetical protein